MNLKKKWASDGATTRLLEGLVGVAIVLAGCLLLSIVYAADSPYGSPLDISSAAFFPGVMSIVFALAGIFLLATVWRSKTPLCLPKIKTNQTYLAMALMVGTALGLPILGIWVTAALSVPALAVIFGERRIWLLLLLAAVVPPIVVYPFESMMGIYFPKGVFL